MLGNSIVYYKKYELEETSLVAQMVKRLPTMRETWVRSLGWEDPLEKEMAPYSSTLAWKIPWMEEPGTAPHLNCSTQDFLVATGGI